MTETLLSRPMILAEFTPLVNCVFDVDCSPQMAHLTLAEAEPSRWSHDSERPSFSLLFHSAQNVLLVDATYKMACGDFGPEWIHISPVAPPLSAPTGHYYEAVFN